MVEGAYFPFTADPLIILAVFIGSLIFFDFFFTRVMKFDEIQWKRTDYFWLSLAIMGVIGTATANVRISAATSQLNLFKQQIEWSFSNLKYVANNTNSVCIQFVKTEFSPDNFDDTQSEFNQACEWFKDVSNAINGHVEKMYEAINPTVFPNIPKNTSKQLKESFGYFESALSVYNERANSYKTLKEAAQLNSFEKGLFWFSPFLLAIAVALRFAKVFGEIHLAIRKKNSPAV